ncbi:ABC transporter permease, partial [Bacillus sp. SIMBA_026]
DESRVSDGQDVVIAKSRIIFRRFMRNRTAVAGLFVFLALFLFSLVGGFLTPWNKDTIDPYNIGMGPSPDHFLGTSQAGIDLLALIVEGT